MKHESIGKRIIDRMTKEAGEQVVVVDNPETDRILPAILIASGEKAKSSEWKCLMIEESTSGASLLFDNARWTFVLFCLGAFGPFIQLLHGSIVRLLRNLRKLSAPQFLGLIKALLDRASHRLDLAAVTTG